MKCEAEIRFRFAVAQTLWKYLITDVTQPDISWTLSSPGNFYTLVLF